MGLGYPGTDQRQSQTDSSWNMEWTEYYQSKPRKVDVDNVVAVSARSETLVVQKSDGSLWAYGNAGSLPCRTGEGGEDEYVAAFQKFIDGVKVSPNIAVSRSAASATPDNPATPADPGTSKPAASGTGRLNFPGAFYSDAVNWGGRRRTAAGHRRSLRPQKYVPPRSNIVTYLYRDLAE